MGTLDKDFIKVIKAAGTVQGMDPLMSEIFARIYISPEPISMEELTRKTGYSLSSISNKLKMLLLTGIVNRVKKPGTKRLYLYIEKDMSKLIKDQMMKKEQVFASILLTELPEIIKKHESDPSSDPEKLEIIKDYLHQIIKFEKILKNFRIAMEKM